MTLNMNTTNIGQTLWRQSENFFNSLFQVIFTSLNMKFPSHLTLQYIVDQVITQLFNTLSYSLVLLIFIIKVISFCEYGK